MYEDISSDEDPAVEPNKGETDNYTIDASVITAEITTKPMFQHIADAKSSIAAADDNQLPARPTPDTIPLNLYAHKHNRDINPASADTDTHNEPQFKPTLKSPSTWYHVEAGGELIQVNENLDTTNDTPTATPVQDEKPSPNLSAPIKTDIPTLSPYLVHSDLGNTTVDVGNDPIQANIGIDVGTSTINPELHDMACSPRKRDSKDMGTDPIIWWLEETRKNL
jgi:hypothetical protein